MIFGGFAPNSQTADVLSKALGSNTVQSGYVSRSKGEDTRTLQMGERALMTPDELKSIPKGEFVVMKTGSHPMRTRLRLFLDWGITFGEPYQTPEHSQRKVYYAGRQELEAAIIQRYWTEPEKKEPTHPLQKGLVGQMADEYSQENVHGSKPMATMPKRSRGGDGASNGGR